MKFEDALDQLPVEKKARRLKLIWPLIEAKLAEGVSHAAVLELLNRNGFDLTEGTYKNYLHRFRWQRGAPSSFRNEAQETLERMRRRVERYPEAMALRRETAEHPFANLKHRILGNGRFLLRINGAGGEMALAVLAYNFRRALNLLGAAAFRQRLAIQRA